MVPQSGPSLLSGDNRLVRGTKRKSLTNIKIICKLFFSEFFQNMSPTLAVLPQVYNFGGDVALKAALAPQIDIFLLGFGLPPGGIIIANSLVNNLGGQAIADGIASGSSGWLAPKSGYFYAFENDTLNIPAGEYSINAVWRSAGETFVLAQKTQWLEQVDWIGFVPNLSWLGDWHTYSDTGSSGPSPHDQIVVGSELAVPDISFTDDIDIDDDGGNGNGNGNGNGLAPLMIAAVLAKLLLF